MLYRVRSLLRTEMTFTNISNLFAICAEEGWGVPPQVARWFRHGLEGLAMSPVFDIESVF